MFLLPGMPVWFMAFGVGLMTPVPYPIAYALIGGLSADSVVQHSDALKVFPEVQLIDFDFAAKDALERTHPSHIERVWEAGRAFRFLKHEGCFIDHRELTVHTDSEKVFEALQQAVERAGDLDPIARTDQQIVAAVKDQAAGKKWIEWRVDQRVGITYLSQTVFFCPHGLPGFLYWYLLYPFHFMKHRGLIRAIVQETKTQ